MASLLELLTMGGGGGRVRAVGQGGSNNPLYDIQNAQYGSPNVLEQMGLASRNGIFQGPRAARPAPTPAPVASSPFRPSPYSFGNDWSGMRRNIGMSPDPRMGFSGMGGQFGGAMGGGMGGYGQPQRSLFGGANGANSLAQLLGMFASGTSRGY